MSTAIRYLRKKLRHLPLAFSILVILVCLPIVGYQAYYFNKIHPGIEVAGEKVGGLTVVEAAAKLQERVKLPKELKILNENQNFNLKTNEIDAFYDFQASARRAFEYTRTGNFFYDFATRFNLLAQTQNLGLTVTLDQNKIDNALSIFAGQDFVEPIYPAITINKGVVGVSPGASGYEINIEELRSIIGQHLAYADGSDIQMPITKTDPTLTEEEATTAEKRAEKYLGKSIEVKFEYDTFEFSDNKIAPLLNPKGDFYSGKITEEIDKIAQQEDREPQNPKFVFGGGRVNEFQPALDGIKTDKQKLADNIVTSLKKLEQADTKNIVLELPVEKTPPQVTTDKVNNLGIKELIGRGTSTYYHSISSRVHNVVLAASRINGTLVAPGETFSFNDTLGDVSQFTGYQQAYIISDGKTILGDGGGVCQVSTTLFRAILNAGLPITERQAHAYRVGYYEQNSPPGFDATVYGPSPDLKFKNDTPGYILIEATADPKHYSLVFELYGTSDGRVATVTKPVVSNVTPPPDDLYQDDPTLPAGTIKQIDFKAWGAKVVFKYTVTRNGETLISRSFTSNYRPWQAVFLRGTGSAI